MPIPYAISLIRTPSYHLERNKNSFHFSLPSQCPSPSIHVAVSPYSGLLQFKYVCGDLIKNPWPCMLFQLYILTVGETGKWGGEGKQTGKESGI